MRRPMFFFFWVKFLFFTFISIAYGSNAVVLMNIWKNHAEIDNEIQNWKEDPQIKNYFHTVIAIQSNSSGSLPERKYILERLSELSRHKPRSVLYFLFGEITHTNRLQTIDFREIGNELVEIDGQRIAENIAIVVISESHRKLKLKSASTKNFCTAQLTDAAPFFSFRKNLKKIYPPLTTAAFRDTFGIPFRLASGSHFDFETKEGGTPVRPIIAVSINHHAMICRIPGVIGKRFSTALFPACLRILNPVKKVHEDPRFWGRVATLKKRDGGLYKIGELVEYGAEVIPELYDGSRTSKAVGCMVPDLIGKEFADAELPVCLTVKRHQEKKTDIRELDGRIASFKSEDGDPIHPGQMLRRNAEVIPVVYLYEGGKTEDQEQKFFSPTISRCREPKYPTLVHRQDDELLYVIRSKDKNFSQFDDSINALWLRHEAVLDYASSPSHRSPYFYMVSSPEDELDDRYRITCDVYCKATLAPVSTYDTYLENDLPILVKELEGWAFALQISH